MPRKTIYSVDTYQRAARGKLVLVDHREMKTPEEAVSKAAHLADRVAGVIAYSIDADHEFEDYSEPKVLARHGTTPEE